MAIGNHRPTTITLDGQALVHNIEVARKQFAKDTYLFAVVKANAYGHGVKEVAALAKKAKVDGYAVAILDEGLELRDLGYKTDTILVLGITPPTQVLLAAKYGISLTVGDISWLETATTFLCEQNLAPLKVHIAVDTGMGRIGARNTDELLNMIEFIEKQPNLFEFEGLFTHFATADDDNPEYFKKQLANWQTALAAVKNLPKFVHAANSAATLWHNQDVYTNVIRLGAGMYGFNPSGKTLGAPNLQPVLSLQSEIVFVKKVPANTKISYGATYVTKKTEWIATLPIGYADGYLRRMQGYKVLIDGETAEIVGRVTMDQMMIRLARYYPIGTSVTLIGGSQGAYLGAVDLAEYAKTIPYEIVTNLSSRIKREVKMDDSK
ncbi:alanine racemase [Weissella beninensis]|uniref:Alanine racemase n=1 Tax=Periweissella beninensis TaxID=504936 RepID=A0ABT0VJ87_9LACO|nr:alanine racemase [Periweissella beninensis]MBM7544422.1 alanine racemase [Periweissella beninensis]MCM2437891.1 alanine racemase [Periweissella beninensis]